MPKKAPVLECSQEERIKVEELSRSRTEEARLVERAKIIVLLLSGMSVKDTAIRLGIRANTVIDWRRRFQTAGVAGLSDRKRSGKPPKYGKQFRDRVLQVLEQKPPKGFTRWDAPMIAEQLHSSTAAVWRVLRKEGICLQRRRSWCVSTDPGFAPKAADIIGLYLNPPSNALVLSIDEKPSIQELERKTGYVLTSNGKIVRGLKSAYKRHGTLNLFAALNIATSAIHAKTTERRRRIEFLEFMDDIVAEYPAGQEIHVMLDNHCIHKKNAPWLEKHPTVHFHFTPTSASWLNQVEIWFGIMTRKVLRGSSFADREELRQAIEAFVEGYGPNAQPFVWRKREAKGSKLKNTIVNLYK